MNKINFLKIQKGEKQRHHPVGHRFPFFNNNYYFYYFISMFNFSQWIYMDL